MFAGEQSELRKEKYIQYMTYLLDGQKNYIGRDIGTVHSNLAISRAQFDEICANLGLCLESLDVDQNVKKQILKRVKSVMP